MSAGTAAVCNTWPPDTDHPAAGAGHARVTSTRAHAAVPPTPAAQGQRAAARAMRGDGGTSPLSPCEVRRAAQPPRPPVVHAGSRLSTYARRPASYHSRRSSWQCYAQTQNPAVVHCCFASPTMQLRIVQSVHARAGRRDQALATHRPPTARHTEHAQWSRHHTLR